MKRVVLLSVMLLFVIAASAQFYMPKNAIAKEFIKRKLIVTTGTSEDAETFVQGIKDSWPSLDNLVFMSFDDGVKLMKESPSQYAMIQYSHYTKLKFFDGYVKGDFYGVKGLIDDKDGSLKYVFESVFYNPPNPVQMGIAARMFNTYLPNLAKTGKAYTISDDLDRLKTKTLVLVREQLSSSLSLEDARRIYGGNLDIVSAKELNEIVMEKKPGYAFVYEVHSVRHAMFNFIIVDSETYDILSVVSLGNEGFNDLFDVESTPKHLRWMLIRVRLGKTHLKYILGSAAQKINRR